MLALLPLTVLFFLSFLGPSPIPVPTDVFALSLVALGISPVPVLSVLIFGHILGLFFFYHLGYNSGRLIRHWEDKRHNRSYRVAEKLYRRYGKYSLTLCSAPFIGKPLVFIAGVFKLDTPNFIFWYMTGKIIWYGSILALVLLKR